jgi:hypothetical protein
VEGGEKHVANDANYAPLHELVCMDGRLVRHETCLPIRYSGAHESSIVTGDGVRHTGAPTYTVHTRPLPSSVHVPEILFLLRTRRRVHAARKMGRRGRRGADEDDEDEDESDDNGISLSQEPPMLPDSPLDSYRHDGWLVPDDEDEDQVEDESQDCGPSANCADESGDESGEDDEDDESGDGEERGACNRGVRRAKRRFNDDGDKGGRRGDAAPAKRLKVPRPRKVLAPDTSEDESGEEESAQRDSGKPPPRDVYVPGTSEDESDDESDDYNLSGHRISEGAPSGDTVHDVGSSLNARQAEETEDTEEEYDFDEPARDKTASIMQGSTRSDSASAVRSHTAETTTTKPSAPATKASEPSVLTAAGPSMPHAAGPSVPRTAGPSKSRAAGPSMLRAAGPSMPHAAGPSVPSMPRAAGPGVPGPKPRVNKAPWSPTQVRVFAALCGLCEFADEGDAFTTAQVVSTVDHMFGRDAPRPDTVRDALTALVNLGFILRCTAPRGYAYLTGTVSAEVRAVYAQAARHHSLDVAQLRATRLMPAVRKSTSTTTSAKAGAKAATRTFSPVVVRNSGMHVKRTKEGKGYFASTAAAATRPNSATGNAGARADTTACLAGARGETSAGESRAHDCAAESRISALERAVAALDRKVGTLQDSLDRRVGTLQDSLASLAHVAEAFRKFRTDTSKWRAEEMKRRNNSTRTNA